MSENKAVLYENEAELLDISALERERGPVSRFWNRIKSSQYYYLIYAFIIPFALMYLIYLAMGIHPFGDGSVLVLDLNGQYVSFYESLRSFVYGDSSLLYSFGRALGGEYMGIYAYYLASPLSYLVALFPKERILEALLLMFLIKTGLCGATMGFYLHKSSKKLNKTAIVAFSILYALCAYAVVHQNNNMWIDSLIWLPLLTYGIEQLIKNGKYKIFVISLATTVMSNYYIGYMVCIYTAAYFMYYYFAHNERSRNNPIKESAHFLKSFFRIAFFSLLALGISAVIVFGAYYSLQFGKNTFSNPNFSLTQQFDVMDLLSKFFPSSYDTVRPEGWPFVYCGLITVILLPCYFLSKRFSTREKIASGIFIAFFLVSFAASTIDIAWHGFQRPNWLNYRYSFMLCFFLITLAYRSFGDLRRISKKAILASGAAWALILVLLQALEYKNIHDFETVWLSLLCIAVYVGVLMAGKKSFYKNTVSLIIAVMICLEVFCSGLITCVDFGKDVIYTGYSSYNDYFKGIRPIVELVQKNDPSFYRMEKTHHRKTNDNLALGIRGLSCSTSTLNKDTIAFLAAMGYTSQSHWAQYNGGNPVNDSLLGLKYIISDKDLTEYYEVAYQEGNYTAYYNPYYLSIGFGVSDLIDDFMMIPDKTNNETDPNSNPMDRLNALITAMLGEEETVQVFVPLEMTEEGTVKNGTASYIAGHHKYSPSGSSTCSVSYTFDNPEAQELFFYLPSDYQREVNLKVNGTSKGTFFGDRTYRIISFGDQKAGEISLSIELKADVLYVKDNIDMIYYLDRAVFEDAMERLAQKQLVLDEGCTDTHITGTFIAGEGGQTVLLTIPYDQGWHVLVDGEEVEISEALDSLISFKVGEGEHKIELKYMPSAFSVGLTVSIISIIIFVLIMIFEKQFFAFVFGKEEKASDGENEEKEDDIAITDTEETSTSNVDKLWPNDNESPTSDTEASEPDTDIAE